MEAESITRRINLDPNTLLSLCLIDIGNNKSHMEKVARLSKAVALTMGSVESAKTAYFGGLLFHDITDRMLPCPLFNKCDGTVKKCDETKNYVDDFFKKCLNGNIFIAYCIGLKEALRREKYKLTAEAFFINASREVAEKFFEVTTIIGTIVAICDRCVDFLEEKLCNETIRDHLKMEFPDDPEVIRIVMKEVEKMWGVNINTKKMELI